MSKKKNGQKAAQNHLQMLEVEHLTQNQSRAFGEWADDKNLLLYGCAGTGKTFLGLAMGFQEFQREHVDRVVVIRSVVPSRQIGYLPGSASDKAEVYEEPYRDIINDLFGRGDAYEVLKQKGSYEFCTTSFLRGITLDDAVVVVDEIQNMSYGELATVITRAGENTRFIFCGDYSQSDLKGFEREEVLKFFKVLDRMQSFARINFTTNDIVRSGLVKEFLIAETEILRTEDLSS